MIEIDLPCGPRRRVDTLVAPLHRQAGIYDRESVGLDRSTLADWVGRSVFLLTPLGRGHRPRPARRERGASRRHHRHGAGTPYGKDQDRPAVGGLA
jgi:hypothetical protein